MCLDYLDGGIKDKLRVDEEGYVQLWKAVRPDDHGDCQSDFQFKTGMNKADTYLVVSPTIFHSGYRCGFHCFATRADARVWRNGGVKEKIIKVYAKPEWITDCGEQNVCIVYGRVEYLRVCVCKKLLIKTLRHWR